MNIAVFCSGRGTNLQAIIDAIKAGRIRANLRLVISDVEEAYCLKRAENAKIKIIFINPKKFKDKELFDKEVIRYLREEKIDLIVLAGYMRILSPYFVKKYRNKILNIHPTLLPSFKGTSGIKDAWRYGVKVTGVTVHFVTEELDSGPIILQEAVRIEKNDTLELLEEKIHKVEHRLYPEAIRLFCENRLKIIGRKVKIFCFVLGFLFFSLISADNIYAEDNEANGVNYSLIPEVFNKKQIEFSFVRHNRYGTDSFFPCTQEEDDVWRPLTEEEFNYKKRELTYSSAKATAEFFNSIYMPYISRGLFSIIGTAYRVDGYRQKVKEEYGLEIDYKPIDNEIYLIYEREY